MFEFPGYIAQRHLYWSFHEDDWYYEENKFVHEHILDYSIWILTALLCYVLFAGSSKTHQIQGQISKQTLKCATGHCRQAGSVLSC